MSTSICPECGTQQNGGGDFCTSPACGAYLAWDAPRKPRKRPPRPAKARPSAPERASAVIALPEQDALEQPFAVQAGERIAVRALVRNQSEIVDSYVLAVEGFGNERWWTIEPREVHLLPVDTGERYEEEASVLLHPPRAPEASAACWPIRITATSVAHQALAASVSTSVEIVAFDELALAVSAPPSPSRRASALRLRLTNRSNHIVAVAVTGSAEKDKCRVTVAATPPALGPGRFRAIDATVRPNERLLVGRPIDHELSFAARTLAPASQGDGAAPDATLELTRPDLGEVDGGVGGGEGNVGVGVTGISGIGSSGAGAGEIGGSRLGVGGAGGSGAGTATLNARGTGATAQNTKGAEEPGTCTSTYTQRSWLPWWTPRVLAGVLAIALLAVGYYLKLERERVAIPDVRGHYISEARAELETAGLKGRERLEVTTLTSVSSDKPGHEALPIGVGDVVREVPEVGTRLAPKSEVTLYTAVRPHARTVTVPDLYELLPQAAEKALAKAGFAIGDIQPYPPPKDELIVSQNPPAGAHRLPGKTVVDVKLGQLAAVPALFGQSPATAGQKLRAVSLVMGKVLPERPRPSELVAVQSPAADVVVPVGEAVDVELGETVPKLVGLTVLKARGQLGGAGFAGPTLSPTDAPPTDVVVSQSPAPGSVVLESTSVRLLAAPRPAHARHPPKPHSKTGASANTGTSPTVGASANTSAQSTTDPSSTAGGSSGARSTTGPNFAANTGTSTRANGSSGTAAGSPSGESAQEVGAVAAPGTDPSLQRDLRPEPCPALGTGHTPCPVEHRRWRR